MSTKISLHIIYLISMGEKSNYLIHLITIITLLALAESRNKSIIFSSSLGYYNIRQVNNVITIYHHLKARNYKDHDILLLVGELQACCEKNHKFGTLSFADSSYHNIFNNVQLDYQHSELTVASVGNILMGSYGEFVLNKRRLIQQHQQDGNLLIYMTGHGGDYYFKVREKEALIDEQFMHIFSMLSHKNQLSQNPQANKVGVLSDSCSAITPFQTVPLNSKIKNYFALASSSFEEKSLSHGYDVELNQPKSDDFTFYLDELLREAAPLTIGQVQAYMDFDKLKVHSKLISTDKIGSRRTRGKQANWASKELLSEYFHQQRPQLTETIFLSAPGTKFKHMFRPKVEQ